MVHVFMLNRSKATEDKQSHICTPVVPNSAMLSDSYSVTASVTLRNF